MWVVRNPRSDSSLFIFHFRLSGEMRRICAEARSIKDGSRNNARASADTVAGNVFLRRAKIELLRCAVSLSHIQQRTMRVMRFHRMCSLWPATLLCWIYMRVGLFGLRTINSPVVSRSISKTNHIYLAYVCCFRNATSQYGSTPNRWLIKIANIAPVSLNASRNTRPEPEDCRNDLIELGFANMY